ncbi:hypothetical protein PTKIN_Ptkin08bG0151400 [Pterospermum kingtungense]
MCWQVLKGRIAIKVELARRNPLRDSDLLAASLLIGLGCTLLSIMLNFGVWPSGQSFGLFGYVEMKSSTSVRISVKPKSMRLMLTWSCPPQRPAGIEGVLRDHRGKELICFSKNIGMADSNAAEFLAIREAFLLFTSSPWAPSCKLIVESDSLVVVKWTLALVSVAWRMRNVSNHIENLKVLLAGWDIQHTLREANHRTDMLAKDGVNRVVDMVEWITD